MVVKEINGAMFVIDSVFYPVKKTSKVKLTVAVGDFQAGGTSYTWEGQSVTGEPNFEKHPINGAKPIGGTAMHCLTKVVDIRPETNQTSVTFTLEGGVEDRDFPYAVQVAKDNGLANYQISFVFNEVNA